MMIYRIIFLLLLVPVLAFAESRPFNCFNDLPDGAIALKKLQDKYSTVKTMSARFVQNSHLAALDTSELSQGSLLFSKPGKMRWSYEQPETQEFISNGETLWFYQPADNQVLVDRFKNSFQSDLPVSFLLGIGDLNKQFSLKGSCKSDAGIVLQLAPKKSQDDLQTIKILVDDKEFLPLGAELFDVAGNKNSFLFSQLSTNKAIQDSTFNPKFPKGTDIIDNRK